MTNNKSKVFISYSHEDKELLRGLKRHFKPIEAFIDFWDDSRILPGMRWNDEISQALEKAKVAVLMISPDFLASDFIIKQEVPKLLAAADKGNLLLLNIILKPCLFHLFPELNKYQAINDPKTTIISMSEVERERVWTNLASIIYEKLK